MELGKRALINSYLFIILPVEHYSLIDTYYKFFFTSSGRLKPVLNVHWPLHPDLNKKVKNPQLC